MQAEPLGPHNPLQDSRYCGTYMDRHLRWDTQHPHTLTAGLLLRDLRTKTWGPLVSQHSHLELAAGHHMSGYGPAVPTYCQDSHSSPDRPWSTPASSHTWALPAPSPYTCRHTCTSHPPVSQTHTHSQPDPPAPGPWPPRSPPTRPAPHLCTQVHPGTHIPHPGALPSVLTCRNLALASFSFMRPWDTR